jgi:two-component system, OmpR family, sensor histidine kinase SenX3
VVELPVVVLVAVAAALAGAAAWSVVQGRRTEAAAERVRALERVAEEVGASAQAAEALGGHLRRALNAIPQGVLVADGAGALVVRNDVAELFAEARHGEALVQAAVVELLGEALAGAPARRTVELFDPPRRTLVISATPLDEDGRLTGAMVVIDDISERRRLEAVRRDFVANISHELKTPVAAMSLLAETLAAEDDPEVARRLAERIQTEAFRVNRTIEDLLALTRIESEEPLAAHPVAVAQVIDEAVERIRPAAEHAGIDIGVELDDGDLTLVGDRRQLVSALYNLLDNAVKYSDPGSPVMVRAGTDAGAVVLAVVDHGFGIPARDLERVFERFYRVDQARSRETGGTGLGLAIVRHVAANHRGEVAVESRTGEGSTFTLRFPRAGGAATPTPPPEQADAPANSSTQASGGSPAAPTSQAGSR